MAVSEPRENGMDNTRSYVPISKGTMISNYKIVDKIGAGGMGEVYLAKDTELNRKVALKFLPPHLCQAEDCRARFKREAQAAAKLDHPNIVTIHEVSEHQSRPFIVMQYVEGQSLRDLMKGKELSLDRIIDLAIQICEGLSKAHQAGIIHRDIKPSNIIIDTEDRPKLLDFGLAAIQGSEKLTMTGSTLGTIGYMSPEQIQVKKVDQRSDLFSFGVVLYEIITGRVPLKGETEAATLNSVLNDTPEPLSRYKSGVSGELQRITSKLLEKDAEFRYQSAVEVISDLKKLKIDRKSETSRGQPIVSKRQPSIAVLPFIDMSAQKDQEYFCDGIAEEIINALTHVESLRVVARTSAFSFKGKDVDIKEIGRKLSVETLLEGSVRKSGNRLRITAQLINVTDGYHLWSEKYDRDMEDIFAIQDEISEAIVDELRMKLVETKRILLVKRHTDNMDAYNSYLKGRYFWNKRTEEDIEKAIEYFEQAIKVDPNYALAYVGLADSFIVLPDYSLSQLKDFYSRGKKYALKALEIDDTLTEARVSLALIKSNYDWDWIGAENEFKRTIELNPNYASAHHWYALHLMYMARFDEAIGEMKKACELDPLSLVINRNLGQVFYYARQYNEAIESLEKTIEMDPELGSAYLFLAFVYLDKLMYEKAIEELQKSKSLIGRWHPVIEGCLGYAHEQIGKKGAMQEALDQIIERSKYTYFPPFSLGIFYLMSGDKDRAFDWIEKAYKEKDRWLLYLKIELFFEDHRSDPRYIALLKKMGLE